MTIRVKPGEAHLTHHIHLEGQDGEDVGLILCDREGNEDPQSIKRRPYPRSAIKTYSGKQRYSDLEPPFEVIAIDDLSGGRGGEKFDEDESKYMDGWRVDTRAAGRIINGGQETYADGEHRDVEQSLPGDVTWDKIYSGADNVSVSLVAGATFDVGGIWLWIRRIGTASGNVKVELLDSGGSTLKSDTVGIDTICPDLMSVFYEFDITSLALSNGASYSIKVTNQDAGSDSDNCVAVATDGSDPYYRIVDDTGGDAAYRFFSYRQQVYAVSIPYDGSNSTLYMIGYRGVADANTGSLGKLKDSAASFGSPAGDGTIVLIDGEGSDEAQNWRKVSAVDSTTQLSVSPSWNVEHDTTTEYVIVGTSYVEELLDLGGLVTDIAVIDKYVYFAYGDDAAIKRYQGYNNSGTWTTRNDDEPFYARHLLALRDPNNGNIIYGSRNDHDDFGTHVWRARVPRAWGDLYSLLGTLAETDTPFDEQEIANITVSVDGGITKIAAAAAFGTGDAASEELTAVDITEADKIAMLIRSSVTTAAGDLHFKYSDTADLGGTPGEEDIPALTADEWTWVTLDIDPKETASCDDTAIISVGFEIVTDNGAQDIELQGGILLLSDNPAYTELPGDALITGLQAYTGGQESARTNAWVYSENEIYEIQAESSYVAVPLAIEELEALRGKNTGRASTINGPYMYFSLGEEKLERYYNRTLDDVGPDLGAGMPSDRRGTVVALASYPGGVFQAVDAGNDGYSSVLMRTDGQHEIYRAPQTGLRIEDIHIEPILGSNRQRLWISQYGDLLWVPIALNPEQSDDFRFCHESMLQVGQAFSGLQDVEKFFSSIKMITENLSSGDCWIEVDYKVDDADDWTELGTDFETSASQEVDLSDDYDTSGVYIEVRARMYTNDNTVTPVILAILIESLTRVPVKFAYDLVVRLADEDKMLDGERDDVEARDKLDILDGWVADPLPVKMHAWSSFEDDRWVFVEPSPVTFVNKFINDRGQEVRVAQVTLVEI